LAGYNIWRYLKIAAFNPNSFAIENGIRYITARRPEHSLEGLARYVHFLGTLLLLQAVEVLQPYCFYLFNGKP
jgi:hypothetical protein